MLNDLIEEFSFSFEELNINSSQIESAMGYDAYRADQSLIMQIDEVLEVVGNYCSIKGGYKIVGNVSVNIEDSELTIERKIFLTGKIISLQLKNAKEAAILVSTAGKNIEEWSKDLFSKGDLVKGYIVDTIGSEIAEQVIDIVHDLIEQKMLIKGLHVTNRYSPGYCGWSVAEQGMLFSFLPKNFCDIRLTESSLMIPLKSVSGIIGIGRELRRKGYKCDFCDIANCLRRNKNIDRKG